MRFQRLALCATAALGASVGRRRSDSLTWCSSPLEPNSQTVAALVEDYAELIGNYTAALGQSFLADGFTDTSDSINALAGLPLGSVTFASKQAFMDNQANQPRIPLLVTSTNAVSCDTIVVRWTQTFGAENLPSSTASSTTKTSEEAAPPPEQPAFFV